MVPTIPSIESPLVHELIGGEPYAYFPLGNYVVRSRSVLSSTALPRVNRLSILSMPMLTHI